MLKKRKGEVSVAVVQKDFPIGDIEGNMNRIMDSIQDAHKRMAAQICIFPELTLCGYSPEDLLWQPDFKKASQQAMERIIKYTKKFPKMLVVIGFPDYVGTKILNGMAILKGGKKIKIYHKQLLPNYGVFDEKRYFTSEVKNAVLTVEGIRIGFLICEDIWEPEPSAFLAKEKPDLVMVMNSSPFMVDKFNQRLAVVKARTTKHKFSMLYVNVSGAQDDIIFDGGSFLVGRDGKLKWRADFFYEHLYGIKIKKVKKELLVESDSEMPAMPSPEERVYQAILLGVKDYVKKNKIKGVVIGLSGGIDSALVLAIAVDALGADRVIGVSMPSRYTSDMSISAAKEQADILGVKFEVISIETVFDDFLSLLNPLFEGMPKDVTEENIQARCRSVLLMAIANKNHYILLNTSNKSELAMGYGTLYGDMAGAYMVLKDVLKTWVYRLAHYRNSLSQVIPKEIIERAPSAELAPNQTDQDSLPPYEVLDGIIERYVEGFQSVKEIVSAGYKPEMVMDVIKRIDQNEYKRRQGAPGPKVTSRAFIHERRIPITSAWKI